jgi:hypothetical protein
MSTPLPRRLPSPALLSAALLGLACAACSTETRGGDGITSSELIEGMTEADFTERCDARGGMVEVIPHCGGLNTCKGFSYDITTSLLSEHTCAKAATCTGWNCVID